MSARVFFVSLCVCFFFSGAAGADDFAFDDDAPAAPVLAELAADDVVVISGAELLARGYRTLGEALAFEAGFVRARAAGGQRYSLYGVKNGVALVVDGVPVVVDGERDVVDVDDVLDLQEVERVEIVKGPSTTFSGAGALTGTVRVTSKRPGVTGATVRTSAGALLSSSSFPSPASAASPPTAPCATARWPRACRCA